MDTIREVNEIITPETWIVISGYLEKLKVFPKRPIALFATEESMATLFNEKSWGRRVLHSGGDTIATNMAIFHVTAFNKKPLPDYCEINGILVLSPISRRLSIKF